MEFTILVTGGVCDSLAAYRAYRFCEQAIEQGHKIQQVFFYQEGATQANQNVVLLADEYSPLESWQHLASEHQLTLNVCVAAAERRGVLNQEQLQEHEKSALTLGEGFTIVGLASFHDACLNSDRMVQFK